MTVEPATLESANRIPMLRTLGIRLREIGDDFAVMEVTVSDIHCNFFGGAHGGLVATLVDTVSFFPRPLLPSGTNCVTTSLNITCVRPAQLGDTLTARSKLLHMGRRTASISVQITNQDGKLVTHGTVAAMILE